MKKTIILTFAVMILLSPTAFVDAVNFDSGYYYNFYLYYSKSTLVVDRDFKYSYDVIPGTFVQPQIETTYPYSAKVINLKNVQVADITFDPVLLAKGKTAGKIIVPVPYFADAKEVKFYDSAGSILINISVAESSFCNDDNICNSDNGEDYNNCSNDCKQLVSASTSPSPDPATDDKNTSSLLGPIMYILGGLLIAGGYVGWRIYKKRSSNNLIIQ